MAARHVDAAKESLIAEFKDHQAPDWSSPQPPSVVLRSGAPLLLEEVTEDVLRASVRDLEHLRLVRALGVRSVISVPMIARGRTVGAITCCLTEKTRCYGSGDVTVVQEIAQRAALAIDNAACSKKRRTRSEPARSSSRLRPTSCTPPSRRCI